MASPTERFSRDELFTNFRNDLREALSSLPGDTYEHKTEDTCKTFLMLHRKDNPAVNGVDTAWGPTAYWKYIAGNDSIFWYQANEWWACCQWLKSKGEPYDSNMPWSSEADIWSRYQTFHREIHEKLTRQDQQTKEAETAMVDDLANVFGSVTVADSQQPQANPDNATEKMVDDLTNTFGAVAIADHQQSLANLNDVTDSISPSAKAPIAPSDLEKQQDSRRRGLGAINWKLTGIAYTDTIRAMPEVLSVVLKDVSVEQHQVLMDWIELRRQVLTGERLDPFTLTPYQRQVMTIQRRAAHMGQRRLLGHRTDGKANGHPRSRGVRRVTDELLRTVAMSRVAKGG